LICQSLAALAQRMEKQFKRHNQAEIMENYRYLPPGLTKEML
jgi:hypothetical protein